MFIAVSFIRAENEATQMSLSGLIDQQNMERPYGGILLSHQGRTFHHVDEPQNDYAEWKKPDFFFF